MLFMVIERFRDGNIEAVGQRFRERGRMMPPGVEYVASWVHPDGSVCYQLMSAPAAEALRGWTCHWDDLVDFEIHPVQTSADFWQGRNPSA